MKTPFAHAEVEKVFEGYPAAPRKKLLALRELIFRTAAATPGVGELEENLKWGEPAYLTSKSKSGSTVRIAWKKTRPDEYAMYFNCQTTLVDTFRTLFANELVFDGNRAILFKTSEVMPGDTIAFCVVAALTYRRR